MMWLMWLGMQSANAVEPMAWHWDSGQSRRYLTGALYDSPWVIYLVEEKGAWVRVYKVGVQVLMTCSVESTLPKDRGWFIECPIEDASMWAVPVDEDMGRAAGVVHEYEAWMEQATVAYKLAPDGRISQIRMKGVEGNNERARFILENLERFVGRAVASLDVQLADGSAENWRIRQPAATDFPIPSMMSQFKGKVTYETTEDDDRLLLTRFTGGYGYNDSTFNGVGLQKALYDRDAFAVRSTVVDIGSATNSVGAAGSVPYRLHAYTEQVAIDAEIELNASKGW